jgi:hypothetical protein
MSWQPEHAGVWGMTSDRPTPYLNHPMSGFMRMTLTAPAIGANGFRLRRADGVSYFVSLHPEGCVCINGKDTGKSVSVGREYVVRLIVNETGVEEFTVRTVRRQAFIDFLHHPGMPAIIRRWMNTARGRKLIG